MKNLKELWHWALIALTLGFLTGLLWVVGCHTLHGMGQDITHATGSYIQSAETQMD